MVKINDPLFEPITVFLDLLDDDSREAALRYALLSNSLVHSKGMMQFLDNGNAGIGELIADRITDYNYRDYLDKIIKHLREITNRTSG